jgi:HK97 family phage prohead protease
MKTNQLVVYEAVLEAPTETAKGYTELRGRAVPYGVFTNRGWFLESVRYGAFDKSIAEAGAALPLHLFHDSERFPIGAAVEWDSRKDALYGLWRLDGGPEAQRAAQLAADGLLAYMSVGHAPIRNEWELVDTDEWNPDMGPDHMDRLTRVESRLAEVSLLTVPAFPQAQVLSVASAHRDPDLARRRSVVRPTLRAWQGWRQAAGPKSPTAGPDWWTP